MLGPFIVLAVFLGSGVLALSQSDVSARKVAFKRLVVQGPESLAFLKTGEKIADSPFTGMAFVEENWGRAEMTYLNGVLNGPVIVVTRNRILSQFEYKNDQKVFSE